MDYSFDKNKVEYIVKYEKKKPVLYVIAAKKAKDPYFHMYQQFQRHPTA